MRRLRRGLVVALLMVTGVPASGLPGVAVARLGLPAADLPGAPPVRPPLLHETVPKPPGRHYEWIGGHWVWDGQKFAWLKGGFKQRKPRPFRYIHGRLTGRGGFVTWQPGYFAAENGGRRPVEVPEVQEWRRWRRTAPAGRKQ